MNAAGRFPARLLTAADAAAFSGRVRGEHRTVVFTNGVFDLLHPGHIRYLRDARALGDVLIVAINSDSSVSRLKGPDRPVVLEHERAETLLGLASVDAVVIFPEETPHAIVSTIKPDVLVKGADWGPSDIVGRDVVEARGGRVVRAVLAAGYSTSQLIDRIRALPA